jgi:hypothetical protein
MPTLANAKEEPSFNFKNHNVAPPVDNCTSLQESVSLPVHLARVAQFDIMIDGWSEGKFFDEISDDDETPNDGATSPFIFTFSSSKRSTTNINIT